MATPYGPRRVLAARSGADRRDNAELLEEPQIIQPTPALHDATVSHAEEVDARKRDLASSGRDPHDLATVSAPSGEVLSNKITLRDEMMQLATPIRKSRSEAASRRAHTVPVGSNPERGIVVHEIFTQVDIDGVQVATAEQSVGEFSNDSLICIDVSHAVSLGRDSPPAYPGNPGHCEGRSLRLDAFRLGRG
jgi:hypothetical protein